MNQQYKIPYPASCTLCWSSLGHLLSIHNSSQHPLREEQQHRLLENDQQIQDYIKSRNVKLGTEKSQSLSQTVLIDEGDDDHRKNFIQIGTKIITQTKDEDYDYLYYQFESLNLSTLQKEEAQIQEIQPFEQPAQSFTNYEFIDLSDELILSEQFKNLKIKVEGLDQGGVQKQNLKIQIYDFSSYSYQFLPHLNNFHNFYTEFLKNNKKQNKNKVKFRQLLYLTGLQEYLKVFKSNIQEYFNSKAIEAQIPQLEIMRVLYENIKKNFAPVQLNLVDQYIEYTSQCWNTEWCRNHLYDQLYNIISQAELPNTKEILASFEGSKYSGKIMLTENQKKYFNEVMPALQKGIIIQNLASPSVELKMLASEGSCQQFMSKRSIKQKSQLQQMIRQQINTKISFAQDFLFPHIYMNNLECNLSVMETALSVLNPLQFCIFNKLKERSRGLKKFVESLNSQIRKINFDRQLHAEGQNYQPIAYIHCSVCQEGMQEGLVILCKECNHGGHIQHIKEWFQVDKFCPACFDCECQKYL